MIFPEEKRKVVEIRSNRTDYEGKRRMGKRVAFTVIFLVIAALISLGVYFRVDEKFSDIASDVKEFVADLAKRADAEEESSPVADKPEEKEPAAAKEEKEEPAPEKEEKKKEEKTYATVIFTGDVLLSDYVLSNYDKSGLDGVVSSDLSKKLKAADILEINNEFPYSTRGSKAPNKQYTFRVDPKYVSVIKEMGVDVAGLANNHVLDFGKDALSDTFDTLDDAGIPYIGAGDSVERARKLYVKKVAGMKIGFLAASRVIPVVSWNVMNDTPGVFTTYDPTDLIEDIKAAKEKCDYVFVCVHWGKEATTQLVDYERPMAHKFIDAGADAVIGAHPHVLQGIEAYNGKMIYYSLGNFIFNQSIERTVAVSMKVEPSGITHTLIPASASNAKTSLLTGDAAKNVYSYMDGLSDSVTVTDKGKVIEK